MTAHDGPVGDGHAAGAVAPRLSPRSFAIVVALTVLVFGFGALNVASAVMSFSPKLRGLYTYRSATVGDGLLLPLWAYGLVRAAALQEPWPRHARLVVVCAALAGGAGGAATQIAWLVSATTPRNWTIPAPHSFNFAGWYHAAFLSLASALFAALGAALWLRVRGEPVWQALPRLRLPGAFAITSPPLAFAGLLALDNVSTGQDPLRASTFILPVATLLILYVLMLSATHWRDVKTTTMLSVASVIPAAAVMAIFWPGSVFRGYSLLIALAAVFGGVAIGSSSQRSRVVDRAVAASLIGVSLAGPVIVAADTSQVAFVPLALALVVGMVLAAAEQFLLLRLAGVSAPWTVRESGVLAVGSMLGLACAGVYLADGDEHVRSYAIWFGIAGSILTLTVVAPWIYERFAPVIAGENESMAAHDLSRLKKDAYQVIAGMTGLALISLLSFVIGTTPARDWKTGSWNVFLVVMLIVSATVLVVVTLVLFLVSKRSSPQVMVSAASLSAWFVSQCTLFALAQPSGYVGILIATFMALIVGLFVGEGIGGNMSSLHNLPLDGPVKMIAVLGGMAAGSTVLWLVGVAYMVRGKPSNMPATIASLVISVAAIQLLPYLAARSLHRSQPRRQFAPAAPLAGVLQDSFVSLLLAVFIGWLPVVVLAHIGDLSSWAAVVLAYAGYLSAAYVYIMRNNVEHVDRAFERARKKASGGKIPEDQRTALEALRSHCRSQNILALVALSPLFVIALYSLATERAGFKPHTGMAGFIKSLLVP